MNNKNMTNKEIGQHYIHSGSIEFNLRYNLISYLSLYSERIFKEVYSNLLENCSIASLIKEENRDLLKESVEYWSTIIINEEPKVTYTYEVKQYIKKKYNIDYEFSELYSRIDNTNQEVKTTARNILSLDYNNNSSIYMICEVCDVPNNNYYEILSYKYINATGIVDAMDKAIVYYKYEKEDSDYFNLSNIYVSVVQVKEDEIDGIFSRLKCTADNKLDSYNKAKNTLDEFQNLVKSFKHGE